MEEFQTRRVLDVVNDAVVIVDFDGRIIKTNNAFALLASLKERELCKLDECFEGLDLENMIREKESVTNCKFKSPFHGSIAATVHATVEDSLEAKFCVLVVHKLAIELKKKSLRVTELSDLEQLFNNKDELQKFSSFCAKEACTESVLFLERVTAFENAPLVQRLKLQEEIVALFLTKGATHELNLPERDIQLTLKDVNNGICQTDIFRPLVGIVRQELVNNFNRYKNETVINVNN
jgi:hypothetical protein